MESDERIEKIYYTKKNKLKFEIPYKNGKINGIVKRYRTKDRPDIFASFKDGVLDGEFIAYNQYREKYIVRYYKNGLLDGKFTSYYPNGRIKEECMFEKGKCSDYWHSFKKSGQKEYEVEIHNHKITKAYIHFFLDPKRKFLLTDERIEQVKRRIEKSAKEGLSKLNQILKK